MEFKQLEAFVAVVEYNSFSEAARHLYLTQPTISAHIRSLETELNSKLIIRTTKKLTITPRGYQLYDCAIRMLNIRNNLTEEFTGARKKIIDLAASTIPSSYLLPELLSTFGRQAPDVYFHAWQSDSMGAIQEVLDGSVDLSLVGQKSKMKPAVSVLSAQTRWFSLHPSVRSTWKLPEPEDLLSGFSPCTVYCPGKRVRHQKRNGSVSGTARHFSTRPECGRQNERPGKYQKINCEWSGNFHSFLPFCQGAGKTRQILLFPLEESAYIRTFYIVYSKNRILKPHVKQFIQFIKEYYRHSRPSA